MNLDRHLQLDVLNKIAKEYPFSWQPILEVESEEYSTLAINIHYLKGHGLLSESSTIIKDNPLGQTKGILLINKPKITEKGLDFLQDDGGLSAILNTITIKFEADTLRKILTNQIDQSNLGPEKKKSIKDALGELPAESIKHLTMKLLDEGMENLPSAILLIASYLGVS
ncbi:hypothetical protein [Acinetobacter pittii]|uniref:hypothetical protein n=1 Tax=Acinetobacter pittii TaxID=48296 RepID=UPI0005C48689|nr:hypothetical protein [Acinetobacter pittii]